MILALAIIGAIIFFYTIPIVVDWLNTKLFKGFLWLNDLAAKRVKMLENKEKAQWRQNYEEYVNRRTP